SVSLDAELARGLGGAALRAGRAVLFRTYPLPAVVGSDPNPAEPLLPGLQGFTISFASPMNAETFRDRVVVSPEPEDLRFSAQPETFSLGLRFEAEPLTSYTITLLAGSEDIYGNAIQADWSVQYRIQDVPPGVRLNNAYSFVTTGAYRTNTAVSLFVSGKPEVTFQLYEIPREALLGAFQNLWGDGWLALAARSRLLRTWSAVLDTGSPYSNAKVNLTENPLDGPLPVGNYLLAVFGPSIYAWEENPVVALGVVNSNVTLRRSETEVLVWVTDMQTAEPLPGQEVTLIFNEQPFARGTTNAEGVLRLQTSDLPCCDAALVVLAEAEGRYGVWHSGWVPTAQDQSIYLYTDRPIYRPGETVYFRGAYRNVEDTDFSVAPEMTNVTVTAHVNWDTEVLPQTSFTLTPQGTFSGEIVLPEDVPIGELNIDVAPNVSLLARPNSYATGNVRAQIAEFRVPEFEVTVTPQVDSVVLGEALPVLMNGTFFSGGGVSRAALEWNAQIERGFFHYRGPGRYNFMPSPFKADPWARDYYGPTTIASGSTTTDGDGNALIVLEDLPRDDAYTQVVAVEGALRDESGQTIAGRAFGGCSPGLDLCRGVRGPLLCQRGRSPDRRTHRGDAG
ncbi:MAG: hypothetical protein HC915_21870, partial [Anaerolineae bacterium]|nr:hypothetical protein [Anaerolineae bacterium]